MKKLENDYNFIDWWKKVVFENYANFEGRARRAEYWNFVLANALIYIALAICSIIPFVGYVAIVALVIFALGIIIPSIGVVVRRLHDVGKSGWFYFISFVPLIGGIWLLVLLVTEGERGKNLYGSDPKNPSNDELNEIGQSPIEVNE